MKKIFMLLLISLMLFIFLSVSYASDLNSTEAFSNVDLNVSEIGKLEVSENYLNNLSSSNESSKITKSKPVVSINSKYVFLKDEYGNPISSKKVILKVNGKTFTRISHKWVDRFKGDVFIAETCNLL